MSSIKITKIEEQGWLWSYADSLSPCCNRARSSRSMGWQPMALCYYLSWINWLLFYTTCM